MNNETSSRSKKKYRTSDSMKNNETPREIVHGLFASYETSRSFFTLTATKAQTSSSSTKKKRLTRDRMKNSEVISVSLRGGSDKSKVPFTSSNHFPSSKEVKDSICRYLIENDQDFRVAASPSFKKMINRCSGKVDREIPTVEELKGSIFDDIVKEMDVYVSDIKSSWADTGCSVLLDEWTDPKGRSLMNVLVDCPKGTIYINSYDVSDITGDIHAIENLLEVVLREIGISNVVQVIKNSASSLANEVRMQLTDKFRSVFWTQSASSCIGLMLEKISAIDHIKETLDKANIITGFIDSCPSGFEYLRDRTAFRDLAKRSRVESTIPFRRLNAILQEMGILTKIFLSSDFTCSEFTSTEDCKKVSELIEDRSFWSGALTAVKAAMPLIRLIDWMDENDKQQIGYIYDEIDQAKESIGKEFSNEKPRYKPYWDIIDDVWSGELYSPLHSAGYFLNPNLFYSSDFAIDSEVATGLLRCVTRSTDDVRVQDKISLQLEQYRNAKGRFFEGRDTDPDLVPPVEWWSEYGKDCPELQRLAIRVLSQMCDGASRFRLDRNLAETLTAEDKRGNPIEQNKLREMTHLRYNMMLRNYDSDENSSEATSEENELVDDSDWIDEEALYIMP